MIIFKIINAQFSNMCFWWENADHTKQGTVIFAIGAIICLVALAFLLPWQFTLLVIGWLAI